MPHGSCPQMEGEKEEDQTVKTEPQSNVGSLPMKEERNIVYFVEPLPVTFRPFCNFNSRNENVSMFFFYPSVPSYQERCSQCGHMLCFSTYDERRQLNTNATTCERERERAGLDCQNTDNGIGGDGDGDDL